MRLWPTCRRPVILVVLLLILSGLTLLVESGWDAYRHHVRVNELSEVIDRIAIGDPVGSLDTITEPAQKLGASINRTEVSITFRITARVRLRPGGRDPFTDHRIVIGQGLVLAKEARSGVMHVLCCFGFDEPVYWPLIVRFHWLTLIGLGGIALWSLRGAFAATPPPRPPLRRRTS